MPIEQELQQRSGSQCELCTSTQNLSVYEVPPTQNIGADGFAYACKTCLDQIEESVPMDMNHWRCLNDCMWSDVPAVKVLSWRMLDRIKMEGWPQDLLDMLFLEDETLKWARALSLSPSLKHMDSNGSVLE